MRYPLFILFVASLIFAQDNKFNVSSDRIKKDLNYLGSDLFEGRGTGSTGGELSAKYLAKEFDNAGLIPAGDNGTFYQYIPMHAATPLPTSELNIYSQSDDTTSLMYGDNYVLFKSGQQTFNPVPLPMVFAGYGITAPEFDYNDYYDLDVQGKVVVILEGEPLSDNEEYFAGEFPTVYSYTESKLRIALSRGAAGTIIITNPYQHLVEWESIKRDFSFEDIRLAYSPTANLSVLLYHKFADPLFAAADYSLDDVFLMHAEKKIISFPLKSKLTFRGIFKKRDFLAPNIIGLKQGNDNNLKDRYIIVSAHYDHLGIGPSVNGDSIYNGVLDNAIGTAALLEIARIFKEREIQNARSIIFLLVTGEEKGLLGSTYYTDHPFAPLYKTDANINIDGIAYLDNFRNIIGVGADLSSLGDLLEKTALRNDLTITTIPLEFKSWESFNRSDQISFAKAGIPSILVMEGPDFVNLSYDAGISLLKEYNREVYHTPFDDMNLKLNYSAILQHINFLTDYIIDVSNSDNIPVWNEGVNYKIQRLRTIAEKR